MKAHRLGLWITALALGSTLAGAPALAASAPAPVSTSQPAPVTADEGAPRAQASKRQASYAKREAESPRAADFKGNGVGIYVGGSTLAVVLVVVLIVVLL